MKSQSEVIKQMSDKELMQQLVLSQILFIVISIFLSLFLFEDMSQWLAFFDFHMAKIIYYGIIPGLIIVAMDIVFISVFPKKYFDDGGINERIFKHQSIGIIFFIALVVAVSEELLFRGVLQTAFGYIIASTIFALVHLRYLKKPVLFISVIIISFYIGYMFELTENLNVTITAHFTVDFLLGLLIRFRK